MADQTAPLEAEIRRLIALAGPMPVSEFMALCLSHPAHGYYITHDPLGRTGDFTTAPEISQMFGELIGLWAAAVWHQMGEPPLVRLVELGPGRGTMMLDMLRAAHVMPEFRKAAAVHLVETSPALRARQKETFGNIDVSIAWHDALADVPDGPAIIVANEFFDALPVNQAIKQADGWHERVVRVDQDGNLVFGVARNRRSFSSSRCRRRCAWPRSARSTNGGPIRIRSRSRAASCMAAAPRSSSTMAISRA